MTFHLAATASFMAAQVGDRLTSRIRLGKTSVHDPTANKALLVYTSNSVCIISISGMAYMDDLPIDQWIAERLVGPSTYIHDGPATHWGGVDVPHLRRLRSTLTDGISARFPKQPRHEQDSSLSLLINGFTFTRNAYKGKAYGRAFLLKLSRRRHEPVCEEYKRVPYGAVQWNTHGVVPKQHVKRFDDELRSFLASPSGRFGGADITRRLVDCVRGVGLDPGFPTVGRELISVLVHANGRAEVTFHRDPSGVTPTHVAYSPWVITRGLSMPPQLMSGILPTIESGAGEPLVTFNVEPSLDPVPDGIASNSGQTRVPHPAFHRRRGNDEPRAFPFGRPPRAS